MLHAQALPGLHRHRGDLLLVRDDPITRLNRAVALAEVAGPVAALKEIDELHAPALAAFQPFHAVRADLLARLGMRAAACAASLWRAQTSVSGGASWV